MTDRTLAAGDEYEVSSWEGNDDGEAYTVYTLRMTDRGIDVLFTESEWHDFVNTIMTATSDEHRKLQ